MRGHVVISTGARADLVFVIVDSNKNVRRDKKFLHFGESARHIPEVIRSFLNPFRFVSPTRRERHLIYGASIWIDGGKVGDDKSGAISGM